MKKIGLIVNPIAGMGGSVGLKGTDGEEILALAIERGAKAHVQDKVMQTLRDLNDYHGKIFFYTGSGDLGEKILINQQWPFEISYNSPRTDKTTAEDTIAAAKSFVKEGVDLVVFAGGDGTARNIYEALGENVPSLGIPAGVKIHSPVFALSPKLAGQIIIHYLFQNGGLIKREVLDIDEDSYRIGRPITKLYGALTVPLEKKNMQNRKAPSPLSDGAVQQAIAAFLLDTMSNDYYYLIGAGSTTSALKDLLHYKSSTLGIDLIYQRKALATDLSEKEILTHIAGKKSKLIITPVGGQGFLFGRGNQQLSAKVLDLIGKENIIIVASETKIAGLQSKELTFYTGDDDIDQKLQGYYPVITGYGTKIMLKVRAI